MNVIIKNLILEMKKIKTIINILIHNIVTNIKNIRMIKIIKSFI